MIGFPWRVFVLLFVLTMISPILARIARPVLVRLRVLAEGVIAGLWVAWVLWTVGFPWDPWRKRAWKERDPGNALPWHWEDESLEPVEGDSGWVEWDP